MILDIFFFASAVWLSWYLLRLLYVAATRGYVMALSRTVYDVIADPAGGAASSGESAQTRTEQPFKFWVNIVVALLLLPIAIGGVLVLGSDLWSAVFL